MRTTRLLAAAAAAVGLLTVSALVVAGVPADKAEIKIDQVEGKKGAVTFAHKKHAEEYKTADGKNIACNTCHHTSKVDGSDAKACTTCHVKEGAAQKEHDGKKAPFVAVTKDAGSPNCNNSSPVTGLPSTSTANSDRRPKLPCGPSRTPTG